VVRWIPPRAGETLPRYAERLAATLAPPESCVLCGVSFAGAVALELARWIPARAWVLVSSISTPRELPPWLRAFRRLPRAGCERLLAALGGCAATMPRPLASGSTARAAKLAGAGGSWHRWAAAAVLFWEPGTELERVPVVRIHGDADRTFPVRCVRPDVVIRGGGHALTLTHAREVSEVLLGL
jgi:pimeloyl-ACP methyl ester carboxylesterase